MSCDSTDMAALEKDKSLPQTNSVRDAKRMKRVLDQERTNAGQLYAAVRDGIGGRKATTTPVPTWIDTESGRILLSLDSSGWLNLVGADTFTIANKLQDLEKALRG
ncbi:MAG: ESX secretion-associated protein EspG [Haloechinothrix sp.]